MASPRGNLLLQNLKQLNVVTQTELGTNVAVTTEQIKAIVLLENYYR
jgi:hypothetical protein